MSSKLETSFDFLEKTLSQNSGKCIKFEELRVNCERLRKSVPELLEWAKEANYRDLNANGYWTFLKIVERFINIVENNIRVSNGKPFDMNLVKISRVLLCYLDKLYELRESSYDVDQNYDTKKLLTPMALGTFESFSEYFESDKWNDVSAIYGYYNAFWLSKSMSTIITVFSLITAVVTKFPESLRAIWDRKYRGEILLHALRNATTEFPFSMWAIADWKIHTKLLVPLFSIGKSVTAKTVFIPRQRTWVIPEWSKGKVQRKYFGDYEKKMKGVRCRLIKHSSNANNETLVLHVHGGGFITHSPDSHEMYLRHWASNISGVPILSVDYTLNVAYPTALQEVLDVYLWLISGHTKVKELLGFNPKKIVLCGDSAGGVLAITLCAVLHDIRKIFERNKEPIKLLFPSAFVGIYTTFNLHHLSPSLLLSLIEPVLGAGPLMACIGLYSIGLRYDQDWDAMEKEVENREVLGSSMHWYNNSKLQQLITELKFFVKSVLFGDKRPWYRCDFNMFQQRMRYVSHVADHPYINAMHTDLIESLEDMSIYLITSHFDILLDNNVEFAKNFKGNVVLDVVDDVSHGYLHWCFLSKEANKGSELCLKRLQQAIGYY